VIEPIEIPDATREPAAYVQALVRTLGERAPLEVLRGTPATARELCRGLDDRGWRTPMAEGEWTPLQVVGHLLDVDIVYGFRWRLILTEDRPSYPGYDEKAWSLLPRPDPARLLDALEGLRAANLAMLEGVTDADRDRLGVHAEQGEERFELALNKIAGHDLAHLNQLARTVAAVTAAGPAQSEDESGMSAGRNQGGSDVGAGRNQGGSDVGGSDLGGSGVGGARAGGA
jgi:hypothetical protein